MDTLLAQAGLQPSTLLAFLRLSAFFVASPFPGNLVPAPIRVGLAGGLAWALAPAGADAVELSATGALLEVVQGLALGLLFSLVVRAFTFAGDLAGTQMGLATPGFATPMDHGVTVLAVAYTFLALALFAVGDGPARLVGFLHRWLEVVPAGGNVLGDGAYAITLHGGRELFRSAVQLAAPLITAVFAAQLVLAVLARSVPTLNLFVEGPSLTVSAGIVGLIASIHTFAPLAERLFAQRLSELAAWLGA